MPGNELGDRIHNFFGQENLSQSQHLSQVVDGAWPGVGNTFWHGSQRQIAAPANAKNHNVPQTADSEERHGSSSLHQGLNFSQPIPRPEFFRNRTQVQQPTLNGYVRGHPMFHTRQNDANLLGMDTEPDVTSRGFSFLESQPQPGNGLEFHQKSSGFTDYTESPVNYDFFGGQQQLSSQQPGMLQSLPRQQSGISEMQLLQQQQIMLRQMQDVHRQQQFQKQHEMNQMISLVKQQPGVGHPSSSALINGIPVQDVSNYSWQPDLIPANTNWLQRNVPSAMQGSSSGHMFSPGQGEMPPLVGAVPAQVDQSIHGAPVSGAGVSHSRFPMLQMDKPNLQQISDGSSSFSGNQYPAFSEQVSLQDGNTILRQGHQRKNLIASPASQGLSSGFDMEHLQGVNSQQNSELVHEFHEREDFGGTLLSSQERAISQISPPQKVATLDPMEERILFGSDDSLWDSFGKGAGIASVGFNILDGADISGPSTSLQGGSLSALMQSAVAETSTDIMGTREEWSRLTSLPNEPTTKDQKNQISSNGDKQQLTWANNGFQSPPLNSAPSSLSGNAYANRNYSTTSGVQQVQVEVYENSGTVQTGASQRMIQQFPGEGTKWMQAEPGHDFGKVWHSDSGTDVKTSSGSWPSQQNHPFYNATSSQLPNRSNGLNFHDSAASIAVDGLQNEANENSSQTSQNIEQKSPMLNLMGHSGSAWEVGSVSGSGTEMEQPKYAAGIPQVSRESSDLNNIASMPDSRMSTSLDGRQQLGNSGNIDVWKHVSSSMTTQWTGFPGNSQPDMGKNNQTLELSRKNSLSNGTLDKRDIGNSHAKEKTENGVGSTENYVSDSSCLPGGKQKSSANQNGRKPSVGRKFQYHPMGDVDVDVQPNYGTKRATMPLYMMQQASQQLKTNDQGYPSPLKSARHTAWNSSEIDKSGLSGLPRETGGLDGTPREDMLSATRPSTSSHLDEAVHSPAPLESTHLSQNVLQLFHKMEQSKEQDNAGQISSNNGNFSSEVPESSASEVALPLQENQSSSQQGVGLQLGLSSQKLISQEHPLSSHRHSEAANHLRETNAASARGEVGHMSMTASSVQSLPHDVSGSLRNNVQQNVATSFFPGFPYSKSHYHNQHIADISRQGASSQAVNMSYDRSSSDSKQIEPFGRAQPNQSTTASVPDLTRSTQREASEMSHPSSHSRDTVVWSSLSAGQQHSSSQPSKSYPDVCMPEVKTLKNPETTSSHSHNAEDQTQKGGVIQTESDTLGTQLQSIAREQSGKGDDWTQINPGNRLASAASSDSQIKELTIGRSAGSSISGISISQREIETFGQSLKPNFSSPQSFSSIQQVQGMKNVEVDPYNRIAKKFKGVDGILDAQAVASQGEQELHAHDKMVRDGRTANAPSAGRDDFPNLAGGSNTTSVRSQHSQISPQMAPSWFDRYGAFKNGKILSTYDAHKLVTKTSDSPVPFGSPTDVYHTHSPVERENKSPISPENTSSSQHPEVVSQVLALNGPKKRKTATSDLVPWHREVASGPQRLQTISSSEVNWSKAVNRLAEKAEEADIVDDIPPVRMKRRLVLTTQLMQQLLHPPKMRVLPGDAILNYETAIHLVARSTLGYACCMLCCYRDSMGTPASVRKQLHDEPKTSRKIKDQYFRKVMEGVVHRSRKLEDDLLRLDKRMSVLDLRVECQELEKFAVINRFAKFHGRGQADGAENSSSSDAPTNFHKYFPQRYVTALPMPKNLPDMVQCLSL